MDYNAHAFAHNMEGCKLISDHLRGLQMLFRYLCVNTIDKEKKWVSDVVPLLFIDSLFQLWRYGSRISRGILEYSLLPCSGLAA